MSVLRLKVVAVEVPVTVKMLFVLSQRKFAEEESEDVPSQKATRPEEPEPVKFAPPTHVPLIAKHPAVIFHPLVAVLVAVPVIAKYPVEVALAIIRLATVVEPETYNGPETRKEVVVASVIVALVRMMFVSVASSVVLL